jgi:hypothetical protein
MQTTEGIEFSKGGRNQKTFDQKGAMNSNEEMVQDLTSLI